VPELRFPGFEGAWGVAALGQIADIKLGKMLDKEKQTSGHLLPYLNNISLRWNEVDTSNLPRMYFRDNELDRFGLRSGDVVVCEGGEPGRSALWDGRLPDLKFQKAIHRVRFNVPFEQRLLVLYLEKIAGTTKFEMLFTGGGIKHLTRETFSLLQIPMITLPEQRKIANFLTAVDGRIGQLSQKKALLEDYKKGVMQQLFTQALRFKDDHGNDFPDWEEKTLGDTVIVNPKTSDLPDSFIYIDLESVNAGVLHSPRRISKVDAPSRAQRLLKRGDILYQTVRPYQMNNYLFDLEGVHVASTGYAQLRASKTDARFIYHSLHLPRFVGDVMDRCTGTSYPAINSKDLAQIAISIPSLAEQTKIANFLTALDRKIESVSSQITGMQTWKKGLLQQMFV
jgi:type I restriction enzyme S subunit